MNTTVTIRTGGLKRFLRANRRSIDRKIPRVLSVVAQQGINVIKDRTDAGKEISGRGFKPYSPDYLAWKRRIHPQFGVKPNLQVTNAMLSSMTTSVKGNVAQIFFNQPEQSKKAAFNNQSRPFFGFNDQEVEQLAELFERRLFS